MQGVLPLIHLSVVFSSGCRLKGFKKKYVSLLESLRRENFTTFLILEEENYQICPIPPQVWKVDPL
ncbi:MAG: hypothetical protein R2741_12115 [Methanolobus sp.]